MELSKLAEKDPEFYKYLQENDRELLDFDPDADGDDSMDEDLAVEDENDVETEAERTPVLTKQELQKWQKALLEVFPFYCSHLIVVNIVDNLIASVSASVTQTITCIQIRCTHERRRSSISLEYR